MTNDQFCPVTPDNRHEENRMTEQPTATWTLDVCPSTGARSPRSWVNPGTGMVETIKWDGRPCPGCREMTTEGEVVTNVEGDWWHARCARAALVNANPDRVWLALASQVARRPGHFKAAEIRTVLENVMRIAARSVDDADHRLSRTGGDHD